MNESSGSNNDSLLRTITKQNQRKWSLTVIIQCWLYIGHDGHFVIVLIHKFNVWFILKSSTENDYFKSTFHDNYKLLSIDHQLWTSISTKCLNISYYPAINRFSTVFSSQCWTQRFNTKFALHIPTINNHNKPTSYNCMTRWGTQPNHEFGNRRSKLLHSSWHASQRYNNFTVIYICYLSITINTLRVLSIDFSTFAMIRWGTQPNHEFGNRRSKLQHNSWYARQRYNNNTVINICYLSTQNSHFMESQQNNV